MNYKTFTFSLFCLFSIIGYAQSNFKKGYLVTLQNDTLQGYIDFRETARTPTDVRFKPSLEAKNVAYYTVNDAQEIVVEGYDRYERFEVSISMNEIDYSKLEANLNAINKKDIVFLKVITQGDRINLYSYRDQLKDRFFMLQKPTTTPEELELKIQRNGNELSAINTYRIQLNRAAANYPGYTQELARLIESASYSKPELKKIIEKVNTVTETAKTQTNEIRKKGRFFAGLGVNYSAITYKGATLVNADGLDKNGNPAWKAKTSTHSVLPAISFGYDLFFHPAIQRSYIRTELAITSIRSTVTSLSKLPSPYTEEITNKYELSGVITSFTPQLIYDIYHQKDFALNVGGGMSVRYLLYPTQKLSQHSNMSGQAYSDKVFENYHNMKSLDIVAALQVGAIFKNRFGMNLISNFPSQLKDTHDSSKLFIQEHSSRFNLSFYF